MSDSKTTETADVKEKTEVKVKKEPKEQKEGWKPPMDPGKEGPRIMLFVGQPAAGKTYALHSLIYYYDKHKFFQTGIVFTKTKFNNAWECMPDNLVVDNYTEEMLKAYVENMRTWRTNHGGKLPPPNFIVLDDMMKLINWESPWIQNWLATFRHTNTWIFITCQYLAKGSDTTLRECSNLAFIWRPRIERSYRANWLAFGQNGFEKFDNFKRAILMATEEKYRCLRYDADARDMHVRYATWRAPANIPEFKVTFGKEKRSCD